jgi:hypothetical protein
MVTIAFSISLGSSDRLPSRFPASTETSVTSWRLSQRTRSKSWIDESRKLGDASGGGPENAARGGLTGS